MKKKEINNDIFGRALLQKDKLTGKKYWSTWDGEGKNEIIFSAGQALSFPPDELQIGTQIHLIAPKEEK